MPLAERFNNKVRQRASCATMVLIVMLLASGCGNLVYHRVQPGETLDSVAFLYDQETRDVAAWNGISSSSTLTPGQRLRVAPPSHVTERIRKRHGEPDVPESTDAAPAPAAEEDVVVTPLPDAPAPRPLPPASAPPRSAPAPAPIPAPATPPVRQPPAESRSAAPGRWLRPTDGKIVKQFSADGIGNKGIGIGGKFGQPVRAISGGKVVYSGGGLINYGNLIIIKHDERYLSAYGYNNQLRVKEGDTVTAGQHIADMGRSPDGAVMLHFEVRYNGKPVDPTRYIAGL